MTMNRAKKFLKTLVTSVYKRRFEWKYGKDPFIRRYFGAAFIVNNTDVVAREMAFGRFEKEHIKELLRLLSEPADVFIDIGANAGLYTCVLLQNNAVGTCIAFEPDHRNAQHLRANLFLNDFTAKVQIHELAAGRERARLRLMPGPESNTGFSRIIPKEDAREAYEVEVVPIDQIINLSAKRIVIKMDVEDHELEVIAGMRRLLTQNNVLIQVEVKRTRTEVKRVLEEMGFVLRREYPGDVLMERPANASAVGADSSNPTSAQSERPSE